MTTKEHKALKIISNVIAEHQKPVVACSWGKDSLTVLHLVKQITDDFDVLWNNTGVHYPSVYKLKKKLEKEWNLNVIETKFQKSFWEIVDEYGWPGVKSSDRSDKANAACCYNIKKKPTKDAIKQNEWDLYFDGLTAFESDRRYMNIKEYGLSHYHKSFKLQKVHPIGWWTVDDVWDYIEKHDIPYPDIYDNEVGKYTKRGYSEHRQGHRFDRAIRNGCWTCTLALKHTPEKMQQLREYYPKLWQTLMDKGLAEEIVKRKIGDQGSLFDGYFSDKTKEAWLKNRPCFFDKI